MITEADGQPEDSVHSLCSKKIKLIESIWGGGHHVLPITNRYYTLSRNNKWNPEHLITFEKSK